MMRFFGCVAVVLALVSVGAEKAEATPLLFSIDGKADDDGNDTLNVIDPSDGSTLSSVAITLAGEDVTGGIGLATNPITGVLWALLKTGGSLRTLATINPNTGVATSVGEVPNAGSGSRYQALAFDAAGTLFATEEASHLYTLSQTDATPTFVRDLTTGSGFPSVIAFNPDDGLLYHAAGFGGVFESMDIGTLALTAIDISGTALEDDKVQALTYWAAEGVFLWKADNTDSGPLYRVTAGGVPTFIGGVDHQSRGLAFFNSVPEPTTLLLLGLGLAGLGFVRRRMH